MREPSLGITAAVSGDDNRNASADLQWRPTGESSFRQAHPLTRIDSTHYVGSLFWLNPGTDYEVQVTVTDPDGVSGNPTLATVMKTRADTLAEPGTRTWYVSPTGNDSHSGADPGNAFRNIQRAANLSQPGDLILILPGIYRESVSVPHPGAENQPIVFRGAGSGVIVDGADEGIDNGASWAAENGVYSRITGFQTGHVATEMGRLYQYGSLSELQTMAAGFPGGFYFDGTKLYVKFSDGSSPQSHKMSVARYEDGFYLSSLSHIRIENLEIRHFGSGSYGKGVYLRYCSNVRIWNNTLRDVHMVFAVAPATPCPTYILRNVGYRFGNTRTSRQDGYTASALKINSGYSTPIGPLYLYHNTFWTDSPATDAVALLNPGYSTFIKARNNIMAGTQYALYKVNPVVLDWNYDDLFTADTTRFISWSGTRYGTMSQFQAGTGQELKGLSADPAFLNATGGDFRLSNGSALVDRGLVIPGINDQYAGSGPDVGALDSGPAFPGLSRPAGLRIE